MPSRQQFDTLVAKSKHVHGVLRVKAVHLLGLWSMDSLLTSLTRQALLPRLQASEKRSPHDALDDRRHPSCVAGSCEVDARVASGIELQGCVT